MYFSFHRQLLFPVLASMHLLARAQDGTVTGVVTDAASKETLPGVSIAVGGLARGTSTDAQGGFSLQLPAGERVLRLRSVGYADKEVSVQVVAGTTVALGTLALEASSSQLEQVVVSAGRFEQRVGEVTQSLSVLPANIVRDKNTTSMEDVIVQVPGVVVVDNDPQIRAGSGFSFGAGSRVMMLVDDLPILSGDIGRPSWSFLPVESVEQVEVIKGASSVLYGSAALSGVINVRTLYPRSEPRTRANVFTGFWDTPGHAPAKWWGENPPMFGGASFNHAQQYGNFDLVLGGLAFSDYGFVGPERVDPDTLATDPQRVGPGGYENRARLTFGTRWRDRKVRGLTYGLNGNLMKSRSSTILLWDNTDDGLFRPLPGTLTLTRGTQYYLDPYINWHTAKGVRHRLRGRYYYQDFDNNNDQANSSATLTGEYQFQRKVELFGETMITAGAMVQSINSNAVLYSGDPDGNGQNTAQTYAGYLQVDKKLCQERLSLSGGVRYENFKVNTYEKAQPVFRAGATYRVLKATYLRASYGQGFRFPTIGERYIRTSVGQLNIYPNPEMEPEFSVNIEGGLKQGFKVGSFTGYVDAVVFQQDFDRFVEFTFSQWAVPTATNLGGLGFRSVNTGGARITGFELELAGKGRIGPVDLTMLFGYTHTKPVSTTPDEAYAFSIPFAGQSRPMSYTSTSYNTEGNILKYRITDLFRSDLGLGWKRLTAGVSVRYNSHMRNIDQVFIDFDKGPPAPDVLPTGVTQWMKDRTTGDWIVDVRTGFKLTEQLKLSVIANNLGNTIYAVRPMAIEAPRSWQVQLAWER
jgi:iron complex outermembrane receptor protein